MTSDEQIGMLYNEGWSPPRIARRFKDNPTRVRRRIAYMVRDGLLIHRTQMKKQSIGEFLRERRLVAERARIRTELSARS